MLNILDLLFPKFCIGCQKLGNYLCADCIKLVQRHKQICIVCNKLSPGGLTHDQCKESSKLHGIIIATQYNGIIKKVLYKIKYGFSYNIINELSDKTLLSEKIQNCLQQESLDLCTSIPLHISKHNFRGFNQAELIAKWITKRYHLPYQSLLTKQIPTTSQMKLKKQDRIFNLQNAFKIKGNINIENKNILLVDDVSTTGTTLEEAAKVLKKHGASKIWGLVIASGK